MFVNCCFRTTLNSLSVLDMAVQFDYLTVSTEAMQGSGFEDVEREVMSVN